MEIGKKSAARGDTITQWTTGSDVNECPVSLRREL
jgi:hypothetical protein